METLANLESFTRSAETGSFSAAARRLSLTPAAVSRNVATLERNLGVTLFHRSTRRLVLTEAGERLLVGIGDQLTGLQSALAEAADAGRAPAGTLRVSMPLTLGVQYIVPLLAGFRSEYPAIVLDCHFDNRPVDLVAESFDVAIGGGFGLGGGIVARRLAPLHLIAVAAPSYLAGRRTPQTPAELATCEGIALHSETTGRVRSLTMRTAGGLEEIAALRGTTLVNDPLPAASAALAGLGIAVLAVPDVLPYLAAGALIRLLPDWYVDLGTISIYHATRAHIPRKTRLFIDHIAEHFRGAAFRSTFHAQYSGIASL